MLVGILDGYPLNLREFVDTGLPTETAVPAGLHPSEWHMSFVVHAWTVYVTTPKIQALRYFQR
jgi:hypothetical protein